MLKSLGLIPDESDYRDLVMKLLTEQVGGYYDPDPEDVLHRGLGRQSNSSGRVNAVHELTHALQDQYLDLNAVIKKDLKDNDDDRAPADQAIFEGDAMAVMMDIPCSSPWDGISRQLPDLVTAMRSQFAAMDPEFEVFKNAPMYLKETLSFPLRLRLLVPAEGSFLAALERRRQDLRRPAVLDRADHSPGQVPVLP